MSFSGTWSVYKDATSTRGATTCQCSAYPSSSRVTMLSACDLIRYSVTIAATRFRWAILPPSMATDVGQFFTSISCAVFAAGRYAFPPNWRLNPGAIPHYRLFVATAGRSTFVVGGATHTLEEGGVILVPPGVTHRASHNRSDPLSAYVIDFEAKLHGILDVAEFCGLPISLMPGETRRPKIASSAESITRHLTYLMPGYQLALHTHCVRL